MDLRLHPIEGGEGGALLAAPPCVAQFRPVFWEPIPGTGERVVALIALESDPRSEVSLTPGTHCVLSIERLRAMLGRERGSASYGLLSEAAAFLTHQQNAGLPLAELQPPFHGLVMNLSL